MKIRITGKTRLPKAQVGTQVGTTSYMYNGRSLDPNNPADAAIIKQQEADMAGDMALINNRFGTGTQKPQVMQQQPAMQTMQQPMQQQQPAGMNLFAGPANQFTPTGNQSNPYTWQNFGSSMVSGNFPKQMEIQPQQGTPAAQSPIVDPNAQKSPFTFNMSDKTRKTLSGIGSAADMGKAAIGIASGIAGAFDQAKQNRDLADRQRRNNLTNNLYTADNSVDKGNYSTTGTTYGTLRPDQYVANQGMFAQDGMIVPGADVKLRNFMPEMIINMPSRGPVPQGDLSKPPVYRPAENFMAPSPGLKTDTLTYLSHQQGVAGINAIIAAAKQGKESVGKVGKESIDYNMKNNVGGDFYKKYGNKVTPATFLDYWADKFNRKQEQVAQMSTPYDNMFAEVGEQTGVSPLLLKTIAKIESDFKPEANRSKSTKYKGLMQLNVKTYGQDVVFNPFESIALTAKQLSQNNQRIQFEDGGETSTNMKIRITGAPGADKMEYGGQAKGAYGLDTGSRKIYDDMPEGSYDSVGNMLQPVPEEYANVEAERGETVFGDVNGDGMNEHFTVGGKRHNEGGTPLSLPEGSFIFSDTKKMRIKDPNILKQFGMSAKAGGFTPAAIAKRYKLNEYNAILSDPNADPLSKKTAGLMKANMEQKLSQLANVQEGMKGYPQGQPQAFAETMAMAAYGGYLPQAQIGTEIKTGAKKAASAKDYEGWKNVGQEGNRTYYMKEGQPGATATYPGVRAAIPGGRAGSSWENFIKDQLSKGVTIDELANKKHGTVAGLQKYKEYYKPMTLTTPGTPNQYLYDETMDPVPGTTTTQEEKPKQPGLVPNDFTASGSNIPYGWTNPDKRNLVNAGLDYLSIKKYMPWSPKPQLEAPTPTFFDPSREIAATQEQSNTMTNYLATTGDAQSFMANASGVQGKAAENIANTMGRYNNMNVGVANQFGPMRTEINNRQALMDAQRQQELYNQGVIANQQFDNARRAGRKGFTAAWNQGETNAGNIYNMNQSESPYYFIDPATQRMQFNDENAKAAFFAEIRSGRSANMGNTGAQLNALYKEAYDSLTHITDEKRRADMAEDIAMQKSGMNNRRTSYAYPNNQRLNRTVNTGVGYGAEYANPFVGQ